MFRGIKNWYQWLFKLHPWELVGSNMIRIPEGSILEETYFNHETNEYRTEKIRSNIHEN